MPLDETEDEIRQKAITYCRDQLDIAQAVSDYARMMEPDHTHPARMEYEAEVALYQGYLARLEAGEAHLARQLASQAEQAGDLWATPGSPAVPQGAPPGTLLH